MESTTLTEFPGIYDNPVPTVNDADPPGEGVGMIVIDAVDVLNLSPGIPVGPVSPGVPFIPAGPVEPVEPVGPSSPGAPFEPAGPVVPNLVLASTYALFTSWSG